MAKNSNDEESEVLQAGDRLAGRYVIRRFLKRGGFGVVYLAESEILGKRFAIKEFCPQDWTYRRGKSVHIKTASAGNFKWGLSRFLDEARNLASFHHHNIVKVQEYFEENNTAYMVLDYEDGREFGRWVRDLNEPPTQEQLDALIGPLLEALGEIHRKRKLHRDIAPDNIFIRSDGSPVLLDFGSVRQEIGERSGDMSAVVKAGYSPIEQYAQKGSVQGAWSDIYALAATLYFAVTQERPQEAPERILQDEYVPAAKACQRAGMYRASFLGALDWGLAMQPKDRPQSIAQWSDALLGGRAEESQESVKKRRFFFWTRRNYEKDGLSRGLQFTGHVPYLTIFFTCVLGLLILSTYIMRGIYYERGNANFSKGDYDAAIADYSSAIRLNRDFAKAYSIRGEAHSKKGDYDSAIDDYSSALRIDPDLASLINHNFAGAYLDRGEAKFKEGDYDGAIFDYNQAFEIVPDFASLYRNDLASAYVGRGDAYFNEGNYYGAIVDYDNAIEIDPNFANAYLSRGNAYFKKGTLDDAIFMKSDLDNAIADYDKAIQLDPVLAIQINPKLVKAFIGRARGNLSWGDHDTAIADYGKAIRLDPDSAGAYYNRGIAYRDKGDRDGAIADLRRASELGHPEADKVLDQLGSAR